MNQSDHGKVLEQLSNTSKLLSSIVLEFSVQIYFYRISREMCSNITKVVGYSIVMPKCYPPVWLILIVEYKPSCSLMGDFYIR